MNTNLFELPKLLKEFPKLKITKNTTLSITITGIIEISKTYNDIPIYDEYHIQMEIPRSYPQKKIEVREIGGRIGKYKHKFTNNSLCVGTFADIFVSLSPEFSIFRYVDEFVVSYLYTFSYFSKFGVYPFGDRSHYFDGILEFYQEYFEVSSKEEAKFILASVFDKKSIVHINNISLKFDKSPIYYQNIIEKTEKSDFYELFKLDFEKYKEKIIGESSKKIWLDLSKSKTFFRKIKGT